jgi:hypothetical protein
VEGEEEAGKYKYSKCYLQGNQCMHAMIEVVTRQRAGVFHVTRISFLPHPLGPDLKCRTVSDGSTAISTCLIIGETSRMDLGGQTT